MSKSSPSPPPAPNPADIANSQSAADINTAIAQGIMNRVNQYTPYGSTTYTQTGTQDVNGTAVPTYQENVTLSPLGQSLYNAQGNIANSLAGTAQNLASNLNIQPLNFNASNLPTLPSDPNLFNQQTINAAYGEAKGFLDPQFDLEQRQMEDKLAQQGIPVGSEAYNSAMQQFNNSKNQAYTAALDNAIQQGASNSSALFNMALAGRQQGLSEQQLAQTQPINLLSAILQGSPALQTQPITGAPQVQVAPTDVTGAYGIAQNAEEQNYQAQLQQQNAMFGGLAGLGGAGINAYALMSMMP